MSENKTMTNNAAKSTPMDPNVSVITAGLDIGNGYVKATLMGLDGKEEYVNLPSVAAFVSNPKDFKIEKDAEENFISDLYNQMDVTFTSNMVKQGLRRITGKRSLTSGYDVEEFDVGGISEKATSNLAPILTLGIIAAKALRDYYKSNGKLPTQMLTVHTYAALALPIAEYEKNRRAYASGYKSSTHIITFNAFDVDQPPRVTVVFDDVVIQPEGGTANYAITNKGSEFMTAVLADVARFKPELVDGVTPQAVLAAESTVGVDIGEGTVNFPVFKNGEFDSDVSRTLNQGYGTMLTGAMGALAAAGLNYPSRKALADFMNSKKDNLLPSKKNQFVKTKAIVDEQIYGFAQQVKMTFSAVMRTMGTIAEVVYVYGGGSGPVKEVLWPMLMEVAETHNNNFLVLYLDSNYSRKLNREGLFLVAKSRKEYLERRAAERAAKAAAEQQ